MSMFQNPTKSEEVVLTAMPVAGITTSAGVLYGIRNNNANLVITEATAGALIIIIIYGLCDDEWIELTADIITIDAAGTATVAWAPLQLLSYTRIYVRIEGKAPPALGKYHMLYNNRTVDG